MQLSFYGDPAKKEARIARAKAHVAMDRLISGVYNDDEQRGCSVGCDAIDIGYNSPDSVHAIVSNHDGTPEWLEFLRDNIFEGLPEEKRKWWHVALAEAIPVGVDLTPHYHLISIEILKIALENCHAFKSSIDAVNSVIALHERATNVNLDKSAAQPASQEVWSAADSAARSANLAALSADSAADSAARSANLAALSADSAALSAADSATWLAWLRIANSLIQILEAKS